MADKRASSGILSPSRKSRVDLLDKIEDGLYLGSLAAASDIVLLSKNKINAVLTLDVCPIPARIIKSLKHYKFVAVCDTVKDNLLSHFQECVAFIDESRKTGNVLVHCYFGVSRSSTVVIAYIMAKNKLGVDDAMLRIVSCRPRVLATERNVIPHMRNQKHLWTDARFNDLSEVENLICRRGLFLEPIAWMRDAFNTLQGKLHCPNCNAKLGSFTWLLGVSCSCATHITPAFHVQQKKVDKMMYNPVQHSASMPVLSSMQTAQSPDLADVPALSKNKVALESGSSVDPPSVPISDETDNASNPSSRDEENDENICDLEALENALLACEGENCDSTKMAVEEFGAD
ncbi:unnamed protein product [Notodromas monacha]|uniref:protein-tyrosine-phosphatase n=1 Tax=Notodromas monacha TaxID=399045 RepID=A0A7R9BFX7_9CRUS|nr:unnamed protein product [Notodromas monacha]CAG0913379.1 unnamed protein product [Notodromas monacha]